MENDPRIKKCVRGYSCINVQLQKCHYTWMWKLNQEQVDRKRCKTSESIAPPTPLHQVNNCKKYIHKKSFLWLINYAFTHSVTPFIQRLIHPMASFTNALIHSFSQWLIQPMASFTNAPFIQWPIHPMTHLPMPKFIQWPTQWLIHQWLTH